MPSSKAPVGTVTVPITRTVAPSGSRRAAAIVPPCPGRASTDSGTNELAPSKRTRRNQDNPCMKPPRFIGTCVPQPEAHDCPTSRPGQCDLDEPCGAEMALPQLRHDL